MSNKLTRTLYRGVLRASRTLDSLVPAPSVEVVSKTLSGISLPAGLPETLPTKQIFQEVARRQFRFSDSSDASKSISAALLALPTLNQRIAELTSAAAEAPKSDSSLRLQVGDVIRHKVHGYRAVITRVDSECLAGPKWQATAGVSKFAHGVSQPFYTALVDVRDRPLAQVSYIPHEYAEVVTPSSASMSTVSAAASTTSSAVADIPATMVVHPLVPMYFTEFVASAGRFVPNMQVVAQQTALAAAAAHATASHASGRRTTSDRQVQEELNTGVGSR